MIWKKKLWPFSARMIFTAVTVIKDIVMRFLSTQFITIVYLPVLIVKTFEDISLRFLNNN